METLALTFTKIVNEHSRIGLIYVFGGIGFLAFIAIRTIYRLYFHPLRKIPGPKLAAATHLVEFYYDVILGGKFCWELERMHQRYGPIVRINPRQVHIIDPDFYDEIYAGGNRKRDKDPAFPPRLGMSLSVISTVPHDHHRLRRKILNNFFSKQSVTNLEPMLQSKVDKLAQRFREAKETGTVVKLEYAFAALTADVISHYCYGKSLGYLDEHYPQNDLKEAFNTLFQGIHILYFFPIWGALMNKLPPWLMVKLNPKSKPLAYFRSMVREQSANALEMQAKGKISNKKQSIFNALVDPALPSEERTIDRLTEEGMIVLGAGAETTANTLTLGAYHLIKNPDIMLKLRDELTKTVMPNPTSQPTWNQLEQLPYLTAVVNETLRLAVGGSWRMPRIPTHETLICNGYEIPPGTPLVTSSWFVHMNPAIFPNPKKFDPDRWIAAADSDVHLPRYITNFAKGSRNCLGINLAYAELYLVIARFAREFDMMLHKTTDADVAYDRDFAVFHSDKGPWSVKVLVTKALD
ncbi:benzoate 4-monooxygenase cytochrome P450 [Talaromyces proteolyticus]|uniref:Benzoate 4-monooxygenase cytochrome P450 n=1 Tax=Talaromyces proteolyticus TaxID=1131652 RepID=A0AAD4PVF2_9EURO|nr:benzoate 4-monooxygenase cytochrome P450 [Talaromyces proteolyticus]KAH8696455.1 benzoate 4-monooxygenase cytochrome P450 [Talaromyces proteolyticus]